jgi:hypothetical protein
MHFSCILLFYLIDPISLLGRLVGLVHKEKAHPKRRPGQICRGHIDKTRHRVLMDSITCLYLVIPHPPVAVRQVV